MTQSPDIHPNISPESAELFHLIVENVKEYAIFMTNGEGVVVSWNPGVERLLGYAESEIVGAPISVIFTPEDRAAGAPEREMQTALRTGRAEDKRWHQRKDGSRFWANGLVMPLKNADGVLRGFAKIMRDETAQKISEGKLAESNRRVESVLSSITDAFYTFDRDLRYVYVNRATTEMFNLPEAEFLGKSLDDLFPDVEGNIFHREFKQALKDETPRVFENYYQPFDRWFENRVYPAEDGLSVFTAEITERKRREAELKYQQTLLAALSESVLDGVLIASPEGKLLHFNRQFIEIWNFPADVVESRSDERALEWAANQTADPEAFLARVTDIYNQSDRQFREEMPMNDGRVYERFGAPIKDGETRLGWLWTFRNITDRKTTEEKIRESEESYRILAETASDAIIRIDETSAIQYVNAAAENIFGYTVAEMIGQPLTMLMPEEMRTRHCAGFEHYLKTGKRNLSWESIEVPARHKSGRSFPLEISFGEYHRGERRFFIGIARDITERVRAAENLRESEEQLRALADSIPQLAWMADPNGFIFWYNRRWYEYTGTTAEDMEGWGWQSVHAPEMLPEVVERWKSSLETGEPFEMEFPLKGADGEFRWFLTRVNPLRDAGGRILRWFGTNTDIEELRRARLQSEEANRLKDEFLATLSHELRTPLNAILGWSQMLRNSNLGETERGKALATIERNARSQSQLIDDILDVSRIITGKLRLDVRAVDLSNVIEAAIDAARPAAEAKNIRLQILLDPQAGPISGDPDRLQQVVWNLLSNAVKFTPKGGRVQARLERVNSHVEIVVSDTGKGIEPEFLPHVFDRFRQSDGSMTRRHGGLGLGLAIVRQIVELHGGTVSVASDGENQGATFTVYLPLLPVRRAPASDVPRVHPSAVSHEPLDCPAELTDLRVLLVDDEADSRDLLSLVLDSCGAQVTTAESAVVAFDLVQNKQFDVIISDIGMPDEDGFSLITRIRKLPKAQGGGIPAIALTAYARAEDRVQALRSGFQMHIAKPVEPAELVAAAANLAEHTNDFQSDERK